MKCRETLAWAGVAAAMCAPPVEAGLVDDCRSTSSCWAGAIIACPAGDGHRLSDQGATIYVTARDPSNMPIPNIPGADWWLVGCNDGLALCGGSRSIDADGATDSGGATTISGPILAGGCDIGLAVVVQGAILTQYPACLSGPAPYECHPVEVRSPDVNGDLIVDLVDFAVWAPSFLSATAPPCHDFSYDGVVDIVDFGVFGEHFLHSCQYQ